MRRFLRIILTLACVYSLPGAAVEINDTSMADETNKEWLAHGRTYSEQRFSPLTAINDKTVGELGVAWYTEIPEAVGLAATPLVADGVMYFTGSRNIVRAVDARNGKLIWQYVPERERDRSRVSYLHGSRGVGLWKDKVYVATVSGRLIALNAATGKEVWEVETIDPSEPMYITGAPKIFKGKVLVGNGGSENGSTRGYVTAYDAETGEQAWRFYIVPGNPADGFEDKAMEMAAKTWTGEWWKYGGGGHAWHGFTYDAEFDTLYIGTGNGAPWNRKIRSPDGGDNLFLCSVVALDPDTGEYLWHYQTVPGETWDYGSNMDIVLADLKIDNKIVKALMHAPKNGFFYVIDRSNGKLISAEPFAEVNWASHIDMKTGRPVEIPGARYEDGRETIVPSALGAHNWPSMSYNPKTGLAYIPTIHLSIDFSDTELDLENWESPDWQTPAPTGGQGVEFNYQTKEQGSRGSLQAWDPVSQKRVWEVDLSEPWNPGTLTTAGNLVFQGTATGDLVAYNAATGAELWRYGAGLGIAAPPITYELDGKQYVSLLVGWGSAWAMGAGQDAHDLGWAYGRHKRRLLTFALDGKAVPRPQPAPTPPMPVDAPFFEVDEGLAARGAEVYGQCGWCHGPLGISGGLAPDLRASGIPIAAEAFKAVVHSGRVDLGMPAYEALEDEHLDALRHFIRQQANLALEKN